MADLSTLAGGAPPDQDELEAVLVELTAAGTVVLQHNYCPDPHFADEDLRVVALVDHAQPGGEEIALASAQRLWERWLQAFLASHRCT